MKYTELCELTVLCLLRDGKNILLQDWHSEFQYTADWEVLIR